MLPSEKLQSQLTILEKKQSQLIYQSKAWYALDGKIKQVKQKLQSAKNFEFLAQ